MGDKTGIPWAQATWNPVTGCSKVSTGCRSCYAESMAKRLQAIGSKGYEDGFKVTLHHDRMEIPVRWQRPRMIFVCSMGDLFHEDVPFDFISAVFGVMARASQHTFMLLTKRPARMHEFFVYHRFHEEEDPSMECAWQLLCHERVHHIAGDTGPFHTRLDVNNTAPWPLKNVWLGVTTENQDAANERIPTLIQCPAPVRFISVEPMLGPINIDAAMYPDRSSSSFGYTDGYGEERMLNLVICGCESGKNRREMNLDWVRSLRDQCDAASVPFFLKQMLVDGKITKMPGLDGIVWDKLPSRG